MLTHAWPEIVITLFAFFLVQDEEEVPPESAKDDKDEAQKDETAKEKQDESEKSANEEKSQEKTEEADSKTDAKVRQTPVLM